MDWAFGITISNVQPDPRYKLQSFSVLYFNFIAMKVQQFAVEERRACALRRLA